MPLCDENLQEAIDRKGSNLKLETVLDALRAIVAGLLEIKDLVHRDLKPANVLHHEGRWKLADFGIAKFVEDSTSLQSLRSSRTPRYAAPEQWRLERPTHATDVYALGCVFYALTTGSPPFCGTYDELREAHLKTVPTPVTTCPPRLATFASLMLRKLPEARPTLTRCRDVFDEDFVSTSMLTPAQHALSQAATEVEQQAAREDAERIAREKEIERRRALAYDAVADLKALIGNIDNEIQHQYEHAQHDHNGQLEFGLARFGLKREPQYIGESWWHRDDLRPHVQALDWDIIVSSIISVTTMRGAPSNNYEWSASLVCADRNDGMSFRWYEVAFFSAIARTGREPDEPFALECHDKDFFQALSPAIHTISVAYGPLAIDGEDQADFSERWLSLVARAATGKLQQPQSMPVREFQ